MCVILVEHARGKVTIVTRDMSANRRQNDMSSAQERSRKERNLGVVIDGLHEGAHTPPGMACYPLKRFKWEEPECCVTSTVAFPIA